MEDMPEIDDDEKQKKKFEEKSDSHSRHPMGVKIGPP